MKYLLDTNICIYIIKRRPECVFAKFRALRIGQVAISSITYSELCFGVHKSSQPDKNGQALMQFVGPLQVLPYPDEAAMEYGRIRTCLENAGTPIGPLDTLIAAHAVHLGYTLVTNNVSEFSRVRRLPVENWV
jgi:tRNA(fMet)-specific endonuclease VapC